MLGIGPILGAGIGGFVYQHAGTVVLYIGRLRPGAGGRGRGMVRVVHTRAVRTRCAGTGDRTRRHVTEADEHRAFVERRWPELGVRTFEPVGGGWDCFTYLVNGEWVFQFPRLPGAAERLTKQIAVLPELAREVSSAIPSPEYASTDPVCMGYARIDGRPMSADVDGIWPERLGRFLYDLHLTPPEFVGMRRVDGRDRSRRSPRRGGRPERARAPAALTRRARDGGADARGVPGRRRQLPVRDRPDPRRHRPGARADHRRRRPGRRDRLGRPGGGRSRLRPGVGHQRDARGGGAGARRVRRPARRPVPRAQPVRVHVDALARGEVRRTDPGSPRSSRAAWPASASGSR